MKKILILNGPNINLTGLREKSVYGAKTYDDLIALCQAEAEKLGIELRCIQSNHEGALIDAIQQAYFDGFDGAVFNPGGYTHTSVALHDAIASVPMPIIECHMSNVHARESFRHVSMTASACERSILPFKNARRVNSPGPAGTPPASESAASTRRTTVMPPWQCSSSISSPV